MHRLHCEFIIGLNIRVRVVLFVHNFDYAGNDGCIGSRLHVSKRKQQDETAPVRCRIFLIHSTAVHNRLQRRSERVRLKHTEYAVLQKADKFWDLQSMYTHNTTALALGQDTQFLIVSEIG